MGIFRRLLGHNILLALCIFAMPLAAAKAEELPSCSTPATAQTQANSGTVTLDPQAIWQPRGGDIQFALKITKSWNADDTAFLVCFGWQRSGSNPIRFQPADAARILSIDADRTIHLAVTVPDMDQAPTRDWPGFSTADGAGIYTGFWIVPQAEMRVLGFDSKGNVVADSWAVVGVTSSGFSACVAVAVVLLALLLLSLCKPPGLSGNNPLLRLITTAGGYASLSQFQIVLWTFVVGCSAVYVMALSGNLIELTSGTLVLLGISGAATLGSKLQSVKEDAAAGKPTNPPPAMSQRQSKWSDLVMGRGEIDVTRVQMLFFTLISAAFVTMKVITSYVIPAIPDNFLLLMGISNGVYLASKYTGSSGAAEISAPTGGLVGAPPVPGPVPPPAAAPATPPLPAPTQTPAPVAPAAPSG